MPHALHSAVKVRPLRFTDLQGRDCALKAEGACRLDFLVAGAEAAGLGASVATAALWGLGAVVARIGMVKARPALVNFIGVLVALPMLLAILVGTSQSLAGIGLTWSLVAVLVGVALCSQVLGPLFNYDSIRFIGASRSVTFSSTRIIFSTALGVILLGEGLTLGEATGTVLIVASVLALTAGPGSRSASRSFRMGRGSSEAVVSAFVFSVGNVLTRTAAVGVGSAAAANLLADLLAAPMMLVALALDHREMELSGTDRKTWVLLVLTGAVFALASYTFFVALSVAPVVYVIPLSSSSPLFTITFSLAAIRGMEDVNKAVVLGALLAILGSFLVAMVG